MDSNLCDNEPLALPPDKNLHAAVPPALLERIEHVAESERVSLDELVTEAIEQRLERSGLEDLLAFGRRHAKARGLKPSDVSKAIAEVRAAEAKLGR